jgi:hypothetical protein
VNVHADFYITPGLRGCQQLFFQDGAMYFFPIILAHFLALPDPPGPAPKNRAFRSNDFLPALGQAKNDFRCNPLRPGGFLRSAQSNFLIELFRNFSF